MLLNKIILTSRGLNTKMGRTLIHNALENEYLADKKIYLVSLPEYEVDEILVEACLELGFKKENIILSGECYPKGKVDVIYVTEGNTLEVADYMRRWGIMQYIIELMTSDSKTIYVGASAGAMIAGSDFKLAEDFDSNFVGLREYSGLGLYAGIAIPHFTSEQLENYIRTKSEYELSRYDKNKIYSIANEEVLIFEAGDFP